jgi:hypothetical protein
VIHQAEPDGLDGLDRDEGDAEPQRGRSLCRPREA